MLLAIYSGMSFHDIHDMSSEERSSLADALKFRADQEEQAMKDAKAKSRR